MNITKLANVCVMCGANLEIHKIISGNMEKLYCILVLETGKYLDGTNVAMEKMNVIKLNWKFAFSFNYYLLLILNI